MANKNFTVLIVSQQAGGIKKLRLTPFTLKVAAALSAIAIIFGVLIAYDYPNCKGQAGDLTWLRAETHSHNLEIRAFGEKVTILEEKLKQLRNMETQAKIVLREVNELRKVKKDSPLTLRTRDPKETKEVLPQAACLRQEEIGIFEKGRPPLISRLHQDLLALRKEALRAEQNLRDLQQFLLKKKATLLATPSLWPVEGPISSRFGDLRLSEHSGGTRPHKGVDIPAPPGTPIVAPADGVVSSVGHDPECGRLILLDHGYGYSTLYGHLKKVSVHAGDKVQKGQIIGTVGSSGRSTGPHLHYEVRIQGQPVNPIPYLKQKP